MSIKTDNASIVRQLMRSGLRCAQRKSNFSQRFGQLQKHKQHEEQSVWQPEIECQLKCESTLDVASVPLLSWQNRNSDPSTSKMANKRNWQFSEDPNVRIMLESKQTVHEHAWCPWSCRKVHLRFKHVWASVRVI
eukprot:Selendium_serpulae@DN3286_c0_g1_i3.p1